MKHAFRLWIFSTFVFTVWSLSMYNEYEEFLNHRKYFSYDEMAELLLKLSQNYPSITRLHTIGKSVEDRDLLALEISSDVGNRSLGKPMFKYVGNMHGDEPLGFQLLTYLCLYLVHNYGMNSRVTALLNYTDIFIMPSMNPDGYVASEEGRCDTRSGNVGRGNANGVDLNRDFPDQFNPDTEKSSYLHNRQKETLAMMTWIATQPFVLSANLHGGAVVVSYPFDDFDHRQEQYHLSQPQESRSPDDAVFKYLAASYADKHLTMKKSQNRCRGESFQNGIVNGAHWYELKGGMQDYNYIHSNCFEITVELSCCKFPTASHLVQEWRNNKESFLNYMEQAHIGVKGIVHDADDGSPIAGAAIIVDGINHIVRTSARGEYWRLLTPGTYSISVIAPGYNESEKKVVVVKNQKLKPAVLHFALNKSPQSDMKPIISNASNVPDEAGFILPVEFRHHNQLQLERTLLRIHETYPSITRLYTIGMSVQNRSLNVIEISNMPGHHQPGIPEFKYVANLHGNEVVGREMLLLLAEYFCQNYLLDARITRLLNTTRIHILPSANPDGYAKALMGDMRGTLGRNNYHDVDLNRNFPDQYVEDQPVPEAETMAIMRWLKDYHFVLSGALHGGALVVNYPFDDNKIGATEGKPNLTPDNEVFIMLAHSYANAHPGLFNNSADCLLGGNPFHEGITNGAEWYSVTGSMQDYNYLHEGCLELTIEMGCYKYPLSENLRSYWMDNKESLITFIEQIHRGIAGFIYDADGDPIQDASIDVSGINRTTKSAIDGDYWRILTPGTYTVTFSAPGYKRETHKVTVYNHTTPTILNVTLDFPTRIFPDSASPNIQNGNELASFTDFDEFVKQFRFLESNSDSVAELVSPLSLAPGGKIEWKDSFSFKLTDKIGSPEENKFHVAIVGGLYATEPLTRELLLVFTRHVIKGYSSKVPLVDYIMSNAVLHIVPVFDHPPSYSPTDKDCVTTKYGELVAPLLIIDSRHRENAASQALMKLLKNSAFDLIIVLSGGGNTLKVPHSDEHSVFSTTYKQFKDLSTTHFSANYCSKHEDDKVSDIKSEVLKALSTQFYTKAVQLAVGCCNYNGPNVLQAIEQISVTTVFELIYTVLQGIRGTIRNTIGESLANSYVQIDGFIDVINVSKNSAIFKVSLIPGKHTLRIKCENYSSQTLDVLVTPHKLTDITVILIPANSEQISSIQDITGYIVDSDGHSISGATILTDAGFVTSTNNDGSYYIPNSRGEYRINVTASGYFPIQKLVNATKSSQPVITRMNPMKSNKPIYVPLLLLYGFIGVVVVLSTLYCVIELRTRFSRNRVRFQRVFQHERHHSFDDGNELILDISDKGEPIVKPYYDESDISYESDASSKASSEDVLLYDKSGSISENTRSMRNFS